MAKRDYRLQRRCDHDGCDEHCTYAYSNRKDFNEAQARYISEPWHCKRHHPNGKNIKPESETRTIEKIVECKTSGYENLKEMHFWDGSNGFAHGDEWNAYAEDFPIGTKIITRTTIEVILPA